MNVRIQFNIRFMAGIYYDSRLQLNEYTVKVYFITNTENPADHNVALSRMKHFIYNELESCIFIDETNQEQCQKFIGAGLNITTMPGDPVDQLIGIMLYEKLSAIVEDKLIIGEIEISSMLGDGIVYLHGDNENVNDIIFPEWWRTSDLVHCSLDLINSDKVVTMHQGSVWRELDLQWPDIEDDDPETGNTIVYADFKRLDDKE
jgi:hypothetical protein